MCLGDEKISAWQENQIIHPKRDETRNETGIFLWLCYSQYLYNHLFLVSLNYKDTRQKEVSWIQEPRSPINCSGTLQTKVTGKIFTSKKLPKGRIVVFLLISLEIPTFKNMKNKKTFYQQAVSRIQERLISCH